MSVFRESDYELKVGANAGADLDALKATDPQAHLQIWTLIGELKDDQRLLEHLLDDKYGQSPGDRHTHLFGVQFVGAFAREWPKRENVWRFKIWDLENQGIQFRIVYMYIPLKRWFVILAVAPRAWNYDTSTDLYKRILADYDRLFDSYG